MRGQNESTTKWAENHRDKKWQPTNLFWRSCKAPIGHIIIFSGTFKTQYHSLWSKLSAKGITVHESLEETVLTKIYEDQLGSAEHVLILSDDMDQQWAKMDQQLITPTRGTAISPCASSCRKWVWCRQSSTPTQTVSLRMQRVAIASSRPSTTSFPIVRKKIFMRFLWKLPKSLIAF